MELSVCSTRRKCSEATPVSPRNLADSAMAAHAEDSAKAHPGGTRLSPCNAVGAVRSTALTTCCARASGTKRRCATRATNCDKRASTEPAPAVPQLSTERAKPVTMTSSARRARMPKMGQPVARMSSKDIRRLSNCEPMWKSMPCRSALVRKIMAYMFTATVPRRQGFRFANGTSQGSQGVSPSSRSRKLMMPPCIDSKFMAAMPQ
mmetsp:Transcript_23674/g.76338  ORF Transcript_23674/g.76338 Transcript_23674/m.76338 type:complete len:206 (+) Transcript_23674:211-828(+)